MYYIIQDIVDETISYPKLILINLDRHQYIWCTGVETEEQIIGIFDFVTEQGIHYLSHTTSDEELFNTVAFEVGYATHELKPLGRFLNLSSVVEYFQEWLIAEELSK